MCVEKSVKDTYNIRRTVEKRTNEKSTGEESEKGIHSGNIVREVAKIANGKGGGRPNMAQAGATDVSKVDEALSYASEVIKSQVK